MPFQHLMKENLEPNMLPKMLINKSYLSEKKNHMLFDSAQQTYTYKFQSFLKQCELLTLELGAGGVVQ